ncbi:Holliday junction-specific endonuclease [Streptococcus pneumoniae]|nr:Holliday junction-specific endonuclease [Streptococcus pneumoniae]
MDKYVKQHRDEIEADKFATRQYKKEELVETQSLDDLIQEMREAVEESEAYSEEVPSSRSGRGAKSFSSGTRRVRKEKQKRLCFNRFGACISDYLCQCLLCLSSSESLDQGN